MKIFFWVASMLISFGALSQSMIGAGSSNYAGIHGLYLNPARSVNQKNHTNIHVGTAGFYYSNNFGSWENESSHLASVIENADVLNMNAEDYLFVSDEKLNHFNQQVQLRGPAVNFKLKKQLSIGIFTTLKSFMQFNNAPESLTGYLFSDFELQDAAADKEEDMKFGTHTYSEIGLNLAYRVYQSEKFDLDFGVSVKRLNGIYSSYFIAEAPAVNENNNVNEFVFSATSAQLGYNRIEYPGIELNNIFSGDANGSGIGFDVGIDFLVKDRKVNYIKTLSNFKIYRSSSDYKYRFSISLLDLGSIQFNNDSTTNYETGSLNASVPTDSYEDFYDFNRNMVNLFDLENQASTSEFSYGLPSRLLLEADMNLKKGFYTRLLLSQPLSSFSTAGPRGLAYLALVPRFERKQFVFSLPFSVMENYQTFNLGFFTRLGPIYLGSDNILNLLNMGNYVWGADAYAGLQLVL